jgi:hypothetical protein
MHKDLALKAWLMHDAVRALPDALRKQAEVIDDSLIPSNRPLPIWDTPPIKGFDPSKYQTDQKEVGE